MGGVRLKLGADWRRPSPWLTAASAEHMVFILDSSSDVLFGSRRWITCGLLLNSTPDRDADVRYKNKVGFVRGEAQTIDTGVGARRRVYKKSGGRLEEFNEHAQWEWERDYLRASRPACREQNREMISKAAEIRGDSAARLDMPPGQCMKGLESRLRVCERVSVSMPHFTPRQVLLYQPCRKEAM